MDISKRTIGRDKDKAWAGIDFFGVTLLRSVGTILTPRGAKATKASQGALFVQHPPDAA